MAYLELALERFERPSRLDGITSRFSQPEEQTLHKSERLIEGLVAISC